MKPKALIITGNGLNCEEETAEAFRLAGAEPEQVHITDITGQDVSLTDYQLLALIGGFESGDHLGAGTVQAAKFRFIPHLRDGLQEFIQAGKPVVAICNGFQTIAKIGALPGLDGDYSTQKFTLAPNDSGVFRDAWVYLRFNPDSPCIWTRGTETLYLPVRHGEGKFFTTDQSLVQRMLGENLVVCQYAHPEDLQPTMESPHNPNGSLDAIAGVCDPTGLVFGLMPHPEAYLSPYNHPNWTRQRIAGELPEQGLGVQIFRNAVEYVEQS